MEVTQNTASNGLDDYGGDIMIRGGIPQSFIEKKILKVGGGGGGGG